MKKKGFARNKPSCQGVIDMKPLYVYQLLEDGTARSYDEAIAAACMQGLANRHAPLVYLVCQDDPKHRSGKPGYDDFGAPIERPRATPWFWLDTMRAPGRWLSDRQVQQLSSFRQLFDLTKDYVKGFVIWDPAVPATVNVATTIAGVEDLMVLSPDLYEAFGKATGLPVKKDLRGMFDGSVTGSRKVDAYRWAIDHYLKKGRCSTRLVGNFNDAWQSRENGWTTYALERDRFVAEKAFCFELSPWDYFQPEDEPDAPLGLEKKTLLEIFETVYTLAQGKNMTEFCGFFNIRKLKKGEPVGVITEWEQVYLMSPYNFYQNTVTNDVYNQTFHKWAPNEPLKQGRPTQKLPLENKVYICMQVCDMDSTTPLYDTMVALWHDPRRGELPLAWGLNPNLSEIFPDLFRYYYDTRTANDYFCADASAAGYFNPSQIAAENWDTVQAHCSHWYRHADMTISGMVLDGEHPSREVLARYAAFSPDGFASLVTNYHGGKQLCPAALQVFDNMPFSPMTIGACDWLGSSLKTAERITELYLSPMSANRPEFLYYRLCYRKPSEMYEIFYDLQRLNPHLQLEMVDPYTYFDLVRRQCEALSPLRSCIVKSQ